MDRTILCRLWRHDCERPQQRFVTTKVSNNRRLESEKYSLPNVLILSDKMQIIIERLSYLAYFIEEMQLKSSKEWRKLLIHTDHSKVVLSAAFRLQSIYSKYDIHRKRTDSRSGVYVFREQSGWCSELVRREAKCRRKGESESSSLHTYEHSYGRREIQLYSTFWWEAKNVFAVYHISGSRLLLPEYFQVEWHN